MSAPRQTPILQYNFNWKTLSVAATLTLWNFYSRIYADAVKKEQVVDFLEALVRHLRVPLLIAWIVCRRTAAGWCRITLPVCRAGFLLPIYRPTRRN
jgi:hypothetical protein